MDVYNNLKEIQKYCNEHKHQFNIEELARLTTKERNILEFVKEYDNKAEQTVIGNVLTGEEDRIKAVTENITLEKFYNEKHKKIYNAILELYKENKKIDILSVKEKLKETGELEEVGGLEYLVDVIDLSGEGKKFRDYIGSIKNRTT